MEIIALVIPVLNLIVGIFVILAILRIFTISNTLKDILQKLTELGALEAEIDQHRRDEFNASISASRSKTCSKFQPIPANLT